MGVLDALLESPRLREEARAGASLREDSEFDRLHPRDLLGRFAKKLAGLGPGEDATLPDGTRVLRSPVREPKYYVHGATGAPPTSTDSPEKAARRAMDISAQTSDPKSVGGEKTYASHLDAIRAADGAKGDGETKQPAAKPKRGRAPERAAGVKAGVTTVSKRGVERGGAKDVTTMDRGELRDLVRHAKHGTVRAAAQNELNRRDEERRAKLGGAGGGSAPANLSRSGLAGDKTGGAKVEVEGVELKPGLTLADGRKIGAIENGKVRVDPSDADRQRTYGMAGRTSARWYKASSPTLAAIIRRHKRESSSS